jgi:Na+:H+ antiporter, NhaA family
LGVALGLCVGKPLGIGGALWLAEKLNLAKRPKGLSWQHVAGLGCVAGIGFTMSLFISNRPMNLPRQQH